MNKQDLVTYISEITDLKKVEAEKALNAAFRGISAALRKEETVTFVGFGSFSVRNRKARIGRNPKTGEVLQIKASKGVRFKPGKVLKSL
ncbi:MAG: HU family DNA-binding protein [Proteobacteria bacterium]|nr:HU family DNA-binding protein [Pseudomonadota bacterium]